MGRKFQFRINKLCTCCKQCFRNETRTDSQAHHPTIARLTFQFHLVTAPPQTCLGWFCRLDCARRAGNMQGQLSPPKAHHGAPRTRLGPGRFVADYASRGADLHTKTFTSPPPRRRLPPPPHLMPLPSLSPPTSPNTRSPLHGGRKKQLRPHPAEPEPHPWF